MIDLLAGMAFCILLVFVVAFITLAPKGEDWKPDGKPDLRKTPKQTDDYWGEQ